MEIRDEAQKEFIALAAHELRNPIQPILGISEILHSKNEYSKNNEYLDVIVRNARKLHNLQKTDRMLQKLKNNHLN